MKLKLVLKFSDAERQALLEFQNILNVEGQPVLSLEQICRQSIFWAVNESHRRARELAKREKVDGKADEGNTPGDSQQAQGSTDADRDPLANTQDTASPG
jgi:hypothetical protein